MDYNFQEIEKRWREYWAENKVFRAANQSDKPKYYVLDMFPYPSGSGLHVGHPLGYIASDILSRYKRLHGYNVLHPMGYDAFGLPAEQYAIQTGKHPAKTTTENIKRYREQLDLIGFSFDWDRQVNTSDPSFYKWTQWIFIQLFNSWYNLDSGKAETIDTLISHLESQGTDGLKAFSDDELNFTSSDWAAYSKKEQSDVLLSFRLAYLAEATVNWCPELGTVLANDEVKDGLSERGGYPVEQRKMTQWMLRIRAYADRLLSNLDGLDWSDSLKEIQRNWIGRSEGAALSFELSNHKEQLEVFTTRPDTIHGVSFMVVAPEHPILENIISTEQEIEVSKYLAWAKARTERERLSEVKEVTGVFTGAYAKHPVTQAEIPIWVSDYVLMGYGTGAIMAVPAGDQRDWDFAKHFKIEIPHIFDADISEAACEDKQAVLINSGELSNLRASEAIPKALDMFESMNLGERKVNYKLRDAVFSRQRYWGEPFPIAYEDGIPYALNDEDLALVLPEVDKYLPTAEGAPPLGRANDWKDGKGNSLELNTMPGWAGSSWYFLRYMDPHNENEFVSKEAVEYWQNVDVYVGGAEHSTGHLLYFRFWTMFLYDLGFIPFESPAKKLINQGMILAEDGHKMSKRYGNVVNPDDIVEQYGADSLRLHEMFLGPIEDHKPWNTKGIDGVHRFLRKLWRLYHNDQNDFSISKEKATAEELKSLHKTICKVEEDMERFSFNTSVSSFMVCVNELQQLKCNKREILEPLAILISCHAPHIAEELWAKLGNEGSITNASYPKFEEQYLKESSVTYPVMFNGKRRFEIELAADLDAKEIENQSLSSDLAQKWLEGKAPKKVIVVPGKIVNVVV